MATYRWKDPLLAAKLMYTVNCISAAAIWNYLPVFFQDVGYDKVSIGILQAISPVCCILGAPLWGIVADKLNQQRGVHIFTIISGSLLMFSLRYFHNFWLMALMVFLANLQTAPIGPLLDQAVMTQLEQVGGEYGKQRLFGGIGYGIGSYLTGIIVAAMHDIRWAFNVHVIFAFLSLGVLSFLPSGKSSKDSSNFFQGIKNIFRQPSLVYLFVLVFCLGLMFGVINSFLPLFLFNLSKGNAQIVGLATLSATIGELPAFFFANDIVRRLGTTRTLLLSILAYALRISIYSIISNVYLILPFELLHGITFSLSWAACTNFTFQVAPAGTIATMLGLLSAMLNGFGKGIGTLIGGWIYNNYGPVVMWRVTDLGVPLALISLYAFHVTTKKESPENMSFGMDTDVEESGLLSPARLVQTPVFHNRPQCEEQMPLVSSDA